MTNTLPILNSDRLCIRLLEPHEAEMMLTFRTANQSFLGPWEPDREAAYFSLAYWQSQLRRSLLDFRDDRHLNFVILNHTGDKVLGVCNYANIMRGSFQACYLGYALARDSEGQGIMFEALKLTLNYMFEVKQLHRIMAHYMPSNYRSGRVLVRLGFVEEGLAKSLHRIDGHWQDHILTSLLSPKT